ncbi:porin PorA family protein [Gordonia sp. NB41Y]|uniref:porin PorA family protein n=1 Tax=Gordonia sp. NB41Y TaxID=875808 RepID=UPI0009EBA3D9|nr:porin PorA family protein [Gordonia sp. NB41Y]WLP92172.1 porin PorA family protein [Gordonia sp. NB41Y]
MHIRRSSLVLLVLGVILVIGAVLLSTVITPLLSRMPAGLEKGSVFVGTMATPDATGKLAERPVEVQRTMKVDAVQGNSALITSSSAVYATPRSEGAQPIGGSAQKYAINRSDFTQEPAFDNVAVIDQHGGAVIGVPPNPSHDGQSYYDHYLGRAVPLTFAETGDVEGRSVVRYTYDASGALADEKTATTMKAALGKKFGTDGSVIPTQALTLMGVPASALDGLGATVPVTIVAHTVATMTADKQFGSFLVVDQKISMGAAIGDLDKLIFTIPMQVTDVHTSDASVASAAAELTDNAAKLAWIRLWIPLIVGLLGAIAVVVAIIRRRPPQVGAPTSGDDNAPASGELSLPTGSSATDEVSAR